MSLLLPSQLPFGRLQVDDVWLSYDGPRIFIAKNASGHLFLFNALDETESEMSYLAVPLSERRKTAVRSGSIGLRTVFTEPEDGMVLRSCSGKSRRRS
jgi:hypothetical protein